MKFIHNVCRLLIPAITLGIFSGSWSAAQSPDPAGTTAAAGGAVGSSAAIVGKWTYRSFVSDPDLNTQPNDLLFGSGTMELSVTAADNLSGTLGGPGWQLNLAGKVMAGTPVSIRFTGSGTIGGEPWVYDYLGYAVPAWPNGVDQRPAIVGTIVRTIAHSGGKAPAGVVAQWIAVKKPAAAAAAAADMRMMPEPTALQLQPRKELPSDRLLRQRYLLESPLNEATDDLRKLNLAPTAAGATVAAAATSASTSAVPTEV